MRRVPLTVVCALICVSAQSGCSPQVPLNLSQRTVTQILPYLNANSVMSAITHDSHPDSASFLNSYYLRADLSGNRVVSMKLILGHFAEGYASLTQAYDAHGRPLKTTIFRKSENRNSVPHVLDSSLGGATFRNPSFQQVVITLNETMLRENSSGGFVTFIYGDRGNVIARIDPAYVRHFLRAVRARVE